MKTTKLYDFIINVIPLAIASVLTGLIASSITEKTVSYGKKDILYAFVAIIVITLLCYIIMHLLLALPKIFYVFRRMSMYLAAAEGYWVEHHIIGERIVSIAQIQYNETDNDYIYSGYSYTYNGEQRGQWYANKIIDESNSHKVKFSFMGQGVVRGNSPTHRTTVNLVGNVDFQNIKHCIFSKINMCTGCYYDFDSSESEKQNTFYAERITKAMWYKYIGKPKPINDLDIKEFVIKYNQDYVERKRKLDMLAPNVNYRKVLKNKPCKCNNHKIRQR